MKILVVDDSLLVRSSMRAMLKTLGHTVILAINGVEAIDLYKSQRPDMVTMDLNMPTMNGISALKTIIRIDPYAKIIMSTSSGSEPLVMEAINYGALGYLLKPITINNLEKAFKKANHEFISEADEAKGAKQEPKAMSDEEFENHLFDDF